MQDKHLEDLQKLSEPDCSQTLRRIAKIILKLFHQYSIIFAKRQGLILEMK